MATKLLKEGLLSRQIRNRIAPNKNRARNLITKNIIPPEEQAKDWFRQYFGSIGSDIFNLGIDLKLPQALNSLSSGAVFRWFQDRTEQLKTFDWNASDQQLEQGMESQNVRIAAAWGSALGYGVGWLAAIGVGYGISFLCPVIGGAALARSVATGALKEGIPEVTRGFEAAISQTAGALANNALTSAFINYRKLFKSIGTKQLEGIYGKDTARFIKEEWGRQSSPNMSFNAGMDEFVESIQDNKLRVFVENFLEEGWDGFTEAGFIVAQEIDNAYAQAKQAAEATKGKKRRVKLKPDARTNEVIVLEGGQNELQAEIQSTLTQSKLIGNRDVGLIVGMPASNYIKAKPMLRSLTIIYRSVSKPPWNEKNGNRAKEVTISIPDVVVGLSWAKLKEVCKPYAWGKYRATLQLSNGRPIVVYGSTKAGAEKQARKFATLSTAKIVDIFVSEEVERKNIDLKKLSVQIYPSMATLLVRRPTAEKPSLNLTSGQKLKEESFTIDLWPNTAPPNATLLK